MKYNSITLHKSNKIGPIKLKMVKNLGYNFFFFFVNVIVANQNLYFVFGRLFILEVIFI